MGEEHLAATLAWLQSRELRHQIDSLGEVTEAGNAAYWRTRWLDCSREDYAILDADRRHRGNCGLRSIDLERRKAEIWAYVAVESGSGLGSAAVDLLLRRAFEQLRLNRVYLRVLASNERAVEFWRRRGFQLEGRARQDTVQDGVFIDSLTFGLLAADYAVASKPPGQAST